MLYPVMIPDPLSLAAGTPARLMLAAALSCPLWLAAAWAMG
jgi:hypothetical protein